MFRVDDGVDGGDVGAKNYRCATSIDGGVTWSTPAEMFDVDGTSLSGPISTILTVLSWICAGIYMCGALPSPAYA